jgi:tRNA pseudouridine55 synthase
MARRHKGRAIHGIVLVDKPLGGSSNHILQKVRRLYQAQKAGHTGALDPLATGMLPMCLGEATKFSQFLLEADKTYEVTAKLGIRTTTSDADGEIVAEKPVEVTEQQIRQACASFVGQSKQVPSMFSALKYQGKPLYFYARQGIEVEREARNIHIYKLDVTDITLPYVKMVVHCSKGTYIRSLVDDLGQLLGCGAYVTRLHRIQVADYPAERMISLEHLSQLVNDEVTTTDFSAIDKHLLPMDTAVKSLPSIHIDDAQIHRFDHGQSVVGKTDAELELGQFFRVYDINSTEFLGVGEVVKKPRDQPRADADALFVSPKRRVML